MTSLPVSPRQLVAACLFAALPLAAAAQNSQQDSLLRSGNLVGGRPHAARPRATSRPAASRPATVAAAAGADPTLARLLHESIDLSRVPPTYPTSTTGFWMRCTPSVGSGAPATGPPPTIPSLNLTSATKPCAKTCPSTSASTCAPTKASFGRSKPPLPAANTGQQGA